MHTRFPFAHAGSKYQYWDQRTMPFLKVETLHIKPFNFTYIFKNKGKLIKEQITCSMDSVMDPNLYDTKQRDKKF